VEQSLSLKTDTRSSIKEIPCLLWNPMFRYSIHRARHSTLSWVRQNQPSPSHPISLGYIVILSSRLCLRFSSGLFPSGLPTKIFYSFRISSKRATCPTHLTSFLWSPWYLVKRGKLWDCALYSFLYPPATSFLPSNSKYLSVMFLTRKYIYHFQKAGYFLLYSNMYRCKGLEKVGAGL
jgi:hypothetical protein